MITRKRRWPMYLFGLSCAAAPSLLLAQEAGMIVTPEQLQNRIAAVQDSTEIDEASRARLVELYRQSISNLDARTSYTQSVEEYRKARRSAPAEIEKIRATLERRRASDPMEGLQSLSSKSSQQLTRLLDDEVANLAAVDAKLAVLDARLATAAHRPADARARIAAARSLMEDLASNPKDRLAREESPQLAEAARWAVETRLEALRAEITMLDEELLSQDARTELLKVQREEAALSVSRINQRIPVLRAAVRERLREEAEGAMTQARAALAGNSSGVPLVRGMAESNIALVGRLQQQLDEMEQLESRERGRARIAQIENAYRSARRKLELEGSRAPLGMAIMVERRQFPSEHEYAREMRVLSRSIVDVSLRLIEAEEERRALSDVKAYADERIDEAGDEAMDSVARSEFESLLTTRRSLLDRAIANDVALQRRFYEFDDALHRVAEKMKAYDELLAEQLLWVRSTSAIDAAALARLPREVADYLDPDRWLQTARDAAARLVRMPIFSILLALAVVLAWCRGRIRAGIIECGRGAGRVGGDTVKSTVKALMLTLMLAAPVPLVLGAIGGALSTAGEAAPFSNAVGSALLKSVSWIALPIVMLTLFLPGGVANRHFGWDDGFLAQLRRQLAWFIGLVFPVYLVLRTSLAVDPPEYAGGTLTFLCFVAIMAGLIALIIGTVHPTRGTIRHFLASRSSGARWRWRYVGFPLAVVLPASLIVLGWIGYTYTAQELLRRLLQSIWCLVSIWLGTALVRRWLMLTGRRLAMDAAVAGSDAAGASRIGDKGEADVELGEPRVDLVALGADTRQLLNAVVLLTAALVLAAIWGDVFPALGILEEVKLWNHSALLDGAQRPVPVTLLDLLIAAVTGVGGYILARYAPSLLDIILLKQGSISASGRYTAGTLTRYTFTAVTLLMVLHRLGASTSQLGWAAAALGVGIGFGLQEIVANFICGVILLFERPVRVGDVITIGDASGVVARIRIRATTIRDWEQKELVVPNKELITGRLLNWTLSDSVTRIFIAVGVAYGSDVDRAMALLREAAAENPLVLKEPESRVHFEQFGESSLNLTLRAYTGNVADRLTVTTELHQAIDRKFRAAGIVIAFPQRDVHLHSGDRGAEIS